VALVERAAADFDQAKAEKMAKKMAKGVFDLDDLAEQLRQMQKMGGMQGIMGYLPGVQKMKKQIADTGITDKMFKRQEAIITSMTPTERKKPDLLNASRKRRIAKGSGVEVSEVNRLLKQHRQMADTFKAMSRDGGKNMARMAQALGMGGAGGMGMPKGVTPPGGMMNAMGGGGMDLNALKALGSGKPPGGPANPNSASGQPTGLPGLGGLPGPGRGLPNLPGLGRPGSGKT
jgi:signal recognition particle subunit SRP54